jgi:type 1 glutamine amidotransferase
VLVLLATEAPAAAPPLKAGRKKVVLIAGKKSHGPEGNGIHDYPWSVKLLKVMLDSSNIRDRVRVEYHLGGWPRDPGTLEDADTVMIISDGRDGHLYEEAPHLASPERVRDFDRLMKRGCGLLTFHFSTFTPDRYAGEIWRWSGGYFDWEEDGQRKWYSAITTRQAEVKPASPSHPVLRGVRPFTMREEFYYNIRFKPGDRALVPIWMVPALKGRKPDGDVVAWARQRSGGGRGFGTTCGHFYDNWKHDDFRKMILNAIAWTAQVEVPPGGVEAKFFTHAEITKALAASGDGDAISVLMVTGNAAHKWHNGEKSTPRIRDALRLDPRVKVEVVTDFDELGRRELGGYQAIVLNNYCNWQEPKGPSEKSKRAFASYLREGGGLVLVHFANGAFHPSLPKAGASDWPEYRRIVRRVWNHTPAKGKPASGHDAFGRFLVLPTKAKHAITAGLGRFEVTDELYFHQDGDEPIEPLLHAESKVTRRLEPLAWTYTYGKGRVFQTLLGHSEKTYDAFEAREVLRRAIAWVAGREVRPLDAARDPDKKAASTP